MSGVRIPLPSPIFYLSYFKEKTLIFDLLLEKNNLQLGYKNIISFLISELSSNAHKVLRNCYRIKLMVYFPDTYVEFLRLSLDNDLDQWGYLYHSHNDTIGYSTYVIIHYTDGTQSEELIEVTQEVITVNSAKQVDKVYFDFQWDRVNSVDFDRINLIFYDL